MQPNTVNNHHDTDPRPPRSRPSCWRQWPGPWPRRSSRRHDGPRHRKRSRPSDFLTAAQLARRLGVSRETVRRLAHRRGAAAHRGVPRHPEDHPPVPAAVRRGVRGQRPGGSRPGRLRRCLAGAGHRARTVTARLPRRRTLAAPARFAARWRELAACRGTDLEPVLPRPRRDGRAGAAGLRGVPGPPGVPGLRHHQPDQPRHLGRADRAGTPRAAVLLGACLAAGA